MASAWEQLTKFHIRYFAEPQFINNEEYIVIPHKQESVRSDGIYSYNIKNNKFTKIIDYPTRENYQVYAQTSAYDPKHNCIYLSFVKDLAVSNTRHILRIDLNTKKLDILSQYESNGNFSTLIVIDNKLHQIGGGDKPIHSMWDLSKLQDENYKKVEYKLHGSQTERLRNTGLIYLKSRNCLLLFGGARRNDPSDSIHEFSLTDNKWIELNTKLPRRVSEFGIVKTRSERYVIIMGGSMRDEIYIFDTRDNTIKTSKIKTPVRENFHAAITNNNNEMLTFAFIRDCYRDKEFEDVPQIPLSLMDLIAEWCINDEIYLLQLAEGHHWRINVDTILNATW